MVEVRRIQQITSSHCGPAVLAMLLDAIGVHIDQITITKATGAEKTIEENGITLEQMGVAIQRIAPEATFWYKFESTIDDISYVLKRGYAVGVEWQGLFYDTEEEEEEEEDVYDVGHYSIIRDIDETKQGVVIVNPHQDFAFHDKPFSIPTFLRRWWDTNEVEDPVTHRKRLVEDFRLLFFIAPKDQIFPPEKNFLHF